MSPVTTAVLGVQALLGLVGLAAGGSKVVGQDAQIEEFERYGYSQWFRILTGGAEIVAGTTLLAAFLAPSGLAPIGGVLFGGVMAGAVVTHIRIDDPVSKAAIPAVLLLLALLVVGTRLQVLG